MNSRNGTTTNLLLSTTELLLDELDKDVPGYSGHRNIYLVGLFSMASLAIPLNLAAGLVLIQKQFWRSNVYILLFQLAIADLLVAGFCIVGEAVWNLTIMWYAGDLLCRFYKFMQMFSLYASTFILTGISIDRCVAVLFPLSRSEPRRKSVQVRLLSAMAWIVAAICASPQALIFHTVVTPFQDQLEQCVTHGAYTAKWQEVAYSLSTVAIMFFIPMFIMIFCYIAIFTRVTKEARQASGPAFGGLDPFGHPNNATRRRLYSRARRTTLWMTLVFVIFFIICWAPYYVGTFCFLLQIDIGSNAMGLIFCFGMCSAIINPLIYGSFNLCGKTAKSNTSSASRGNLKCRLVRRACRDNVQMAHHRNVYQPYPLMHTSAMMPYPHLKVKFRSRQWPNTLFTNH